MSAIVPLGKIADTTNRFAPAVVVFPHAGGSPRFYAHWADVLLRYQLWGITYPGRDARLGDEAPATLQALARECADYLDLLLDDATPMPVVRAFHGCLGCLGNGTLPGADGASPFDNDGCLRSKTRLTVRPGTRLHQQDDAALIADLNRQNPTHKRAMGGPRTAQLFLPTVREDYRLLETYRLEPGTVADLSVVYGEDDGEIDTSTIQRWRNASHGAYRTRLLPGGHFYLAAPDTSLPHYLGELLPC